MFSIGLEPGSPQESMQFGLGKLGKCLMLCRKKRGCFAKCRSGRTFFFCILPTDRPVADSMLWTSMDARRSSQVEWISSGRLRSTHLNNSHDLPRVANFGSLRVSGMLCMGTMSISWWRIKTHASLARKMQPLSCRTECP